jgi:hypothetical protein
MLMAEPPKISTSPSHVTKTTTRNSNENPHTPEEASGAILTGKEKQRLTMEIQSNLAKKHYGTH